MLLEDVAVPVQNLAKLCNGINEMFEKFDYHDGSAFGHALEGNLHLVFTQVPCRRAYLCLNAGAFRFLAICLRSRPPGTFPRVLSRWRLQYGRNTVA